MAQANVPIENFRLQRVDREANYAHEYEFLIPFAGPQEDAADDWTCSRIEDPSVTREERDREPWGLHQYAINNDQKAYVVFSADLQETVKPFARKTAMGLYQMVAANWLHAGNAPDSLRFVAFSIITNQAVRDAVREEWTHQAGQGVTPFGSRVQKMLTVTPANSITWDRNYFIRSGIKMARVLSTPERTLTLEKAHLIRRNNNERFMVLEFKNGDEGQENYRESLIREADTMVRHNLEEKQARRTAGLEWENVIFLPPHLRPTSDPSGSSLGTQNQSPQYSSEQGQTPSSGSRSRPTNSPVVSTTTSNDDPFYLENSLNP